MIDAVAEKGYARTVVADVIARAGVSRASFYAQFKDIEDCFLAAYEASVQRMLTRIEEHDTADREAPTGPQLRELLDAYLAAIAADPNGARVFLIEVYGAGPAALKRRYEVLARFVDLLVSRVGDLPGWPKDPRQRRLRCEAVVGAISSMVATRIAAGRPDRIGEIREPALALVGLTAG